MKCVIISVNVDTVSSSNTAAELFEIDPGPLLVGESSG